MWRSSAAAACRNATEMSPAQTIQLLFRLSVKSSLSTLKKAVNRCACVDVVSVCYGFSEPFCACSDFCPFVASDPFASYDVLVLLWCQRVDVDLCANVLWLHLLYLLLHALCCELSVESFCAVDDRF